MIFPPPIKRTHTLAERAALPAEARRAVIRGEAADRRRYVDDYVRLNRPGGIGASPVSAGTGGGTRVAGAGVWGPPLWARIHMLPLSDEWRESPGFAADWVTGPFRSTVPCGICQRELDALMRSMPKPPDDRGAFARWAWELHQGVNRNLGEVGITWEDAMAIYDYPLEWNIDA